VFSSPPAAVRSASSYAVANERARAATGKGLSAQSWALVPKIEAATDFARVSLVRVVEAHPELCFATMADGVPIRAPKPSWAGHRARCRRLESVGLAIPDDLGDAGRAGAPDVLDAAAVAWTAQRLADGRARSLPDPPEVDPEGMPVAIWV
jgi:predicted RNase H-like nuclease